MTDERITVIGGGLAGSEAAWQAAERGVQVRLYEMRPRAVWLRRQRARQQRLRAWQVDGSVSAPKNKID